MTLGEHGPERQHAPWAQLPRSQQSNPAIGRRTSMLDQCTAYLIARTERQTSALDTLARRLGFAHIETLDTRRSFVSAEGATALKFFLIYRQMDPHLMMMVRDVIRKSDDPNVRFAPIVLFTDECDFETYLSFIRMGFDDVLTLPDKKDMLIKRLEGQINAEYAYFETENYLGPDRRRMEAPDHFDPRRGGETTSHIKHTVRRTLTGGSLVIRTELFAHRKAKA